VTIAGGHASGAILLLAEPSGDDATSGGAEASGSVIPSQSITRISCSLAGKASPSQEQGHPPNVARPLTKCPAH